MCDSRSLNALLPNLDDSPLSPEALSVPRELQFCVDAGVSAAACFFDAMTAVGLHDHIAESMQAFTRSIDDVIAHEAALAGHWLIRHKQRCVDAFGAGYLGRIQQELRLFHRDDVKRESNASCSLSPSTKMH